MARGFVYLAAVVDWFSRRVLSWRLSITMQADFCIKAVEKAMARFGKPDILTPIRFAVHQRGLHDGAERQRHQDQHGRQGCLARQRLRRTALEIG